MALGTQEKSIRNKRLAEMKDRVKSNGKKVTFAALAKIMNLSVARTKYLYYREIKRQNVAE